MFAKEGLEGEVAARTAICLIRGGQGTLCYRGYSIDDLAEKATFEEVVHLLWFGELPTCGRMAALSDELKANRNPPPSVLEVLRALPVSTPPIDVLRSAVSMLAATDPQTGDNSEAANLHKGARLTGAMPVLVAFWARLRKGLPPVAPDPKLPHADNFLYMISGRRPDPLQARALDMAMTLQAEHGFNASTFAARVTAGTLADLHAAVTSALGALKGPLHGGALAAVLAMLTAVGEKSQAKAALERMLKAKIKIPGFGHRVYRNTDPRVPHLKRTCKALAAGACDGRWFELCGQVEELMGRRTGLHPNVDFYAAPTYHLLGLEPEDFTPVFACSRAPGWIAHVTEQHLDNRLIRPLEEYIGPLPRAFVPLEQRAEN